MIDVENDWRAVSVVLTLLFGLMTAVLLVVTWT